jgi:sugar/nucleoside kinase (ribokinase family)
MYDVLGVGCNAVDYLCPMDRYPIEDEKMQVDRIEMQGGGNVATALVAAARLGGSVAYHTVIAADHNTEWILASFKQEKVNTDHLIIKDGNNPLAVILINRSTGSRTILYSKRNVPTFQPDEVHGELIQHTKVLLIDFYFPEASLSASKIARSLHIPVVVDAEKPSPLAEQILGNCTHVIASRRFALHFTGMNQNTDEDTLLEEFFLRLESPFVCITFGERGALAIDRETNRTFRQEAFKVDTVDSTGAGDVFHGAFAYFLSREFTLEKIIKYAAACSACKCRQIGGRSGIPTLVELEQFMEEYTD